MWRTVDLLVPLRKDWYFPAINGVGSMVNQVLLPLLGSKPNNGFGDNVVKSECGRVNELLNS